MNKIFLWILFIFIFSISVSAEIDNQTKIVSTPLKISSECWIESIINITDINESLSNIYDIVNCKSNLSIGTQNQDGEKDYKKYNIDNLTDDTFTIRFVESLSCEQSDIVNLTTKCIEKLDNFDQQCSIETEVLGVSGEVNYTSSCVQGFYDYKAKTDNLRSSNSDLSNKATLYDECNSNLTLSQNDYSICESNLLTEQNKNKSATSNYIITLIIGFGAGLGVYHLVTKIKRAKSQETREYGEGHFPDPQISPELVKELEKAEMERLKEKENSK